MATVKNKVELLPHEELKENINSFIVAIQNLSFYSPEQVTSICHDRFKKHAPQLLTESAWKSYKKYIETEQERFAELRDDARLGFTLTFRKISTVRHVQIELMKHLKSFVDSCNELDVLKVYIEMIDHKLPSQKKTAIHPVIESRKIWTKGKKEAASYCWDKTKKSKTASMKKICEQFLAKWTIQGEEDYSVIKLMNYVSQKAKEEKEREAKKKVQRI